MKEKPIVIVICGPTACGKTDLGIQLANRINGEIVSVDSMQIYKDMNIGTAKPTKEEQSQAHHYMIDFVSPDRRYSVADFKKDSIKSINEILEKGKRPILVGGTGFYLNSLIYNIEYPEIKIDFEYRKKLNNLSNEELYERAKEIDSESIKKISTNDRKRIIRILEIFNETGKNKTQIEEQSIKPAIYDYKIFVINRERQELYERINKRVDIMVKNGLFDEVKELTEKYREFPTAMQGIGYKEVYEFYKNKNNETKDQVIDKIKENSRHYAKRQITWFKQYKDAIWLEAKNRNNVEIILEKIK